jgi:hypothetical protein
MVHCQQDCYYDSIAQLDHRVIRLWNYFFGREAAVSAMVAFVRLRGRRCFLPEDLAGLAIEGEHLEMMFDERSGWSTPALSAFSSDGTAGDGDSNKEIIKSATD